MSRFAHILQSSHAHATNNRAELEASDIAGCFHCLETYPASRVGRWLNEGAGTACCPECTIDSVIGDASALPVSEPPFLEAMHQAWFPASSSVRLEGSAG